MVAPGSRPSYSLQLASTSGAKKGHILTIVVPIIIVYFVVDVGLYHFTALAVPVVHVEEFVGRISFDGTTHP